MTDLISLVDLGGVKYRQRRIMNCHCIEYVRHTRVLQCLVTPNTIFFLLGKGEVSLKNSAKREYAATYMWHRKKITIFGGNSSIARDFISSEAGAYPKIK